MRPRKVSTIAIVVVWPLLFLGTAALCAVLTDIPGWEASKNTEKLVSALGDRNPAVRQSASEALQRMGDPLGRLVVNSLKGSKEAQHALAKMKDPRALVPLISALGNWDPTVGQAALDTLSAIADRRSVDLVVEVLNHDISGVRRVSAARILGKLPAQRAVYALIVALRDNDAAVRIAAAEALAQLGDRQAVDPLLAIIGDESLGVRQAAAAALDGLGEPLGRLVLTTLEGSKQSATELVKRKDSRSVPPLIQALRNWNRGVRWNAARTLGEIKDNRAVAPLIELLLDSDADVREMAAWTVGGFSDPPRVPDALMKALGDDNWRVRRAAARMLGWVGGQRAVDALLKALGDINWGVREGAAWALGNIGDKRAVEALLETLDDKSPAVRKVAALALGSVGDKRAVTALILTLGNEDRDLREAAAGALQKLDEPLGQPIHEALGGSLAASQELINRRDPRAITPLISALIFEDSTARRSAARTLGHIVDPRAIDGLITLAGSWNPQDRFVATAALLRMEELAHLPSTTLRVLIQVSTIVYLLSPVLLVIGGYKVIRWRKKAAPVVT